MGFWGKFFKCCGIGNRLKKRGMLASGKCQCAIHYPVSLIEIVDGFCHREIRLALNDPIGPGMQGIFVNFPETAFDISVRGALIIEKTTGGNGKMQS